MAQGKDNKIETIKSLTKRIRLIEEVNSLQAQMLENLQNELNGVDALAELVQQLIDKKDEEPVIEETIPEPSIHRTSEISKEVPFEAPNRLNMTKADVLQSIVNTIRVLPPNLVVDGKHTKKNIEALVGAKISQEEIDLAYKKISGD